MKALDEESEDAFVLALIQDLALSKWDFVSKQKRNDTVKLVKQFLSEKPKSRKVFAEAEGMLHSIFPIVEKLAFHR